MKAREPGCCSLCGRRLSVAGDPLSIDCGGDCWGCMSEIEAEGFGVSIEVYRRDHDKLWAERTADAVRPPASRPGAGRPWWKFWG